MGIEGPIVALTVFPEAGGMTAPAAAASSRYLPSHREKVSRSPPNQLSNINPDLRSL